MSRLILSSGRCLVLGAVFLGCAACTRANRIRGGGTDARTSPLQSQSTVQATTAVNPVRVRTLKQPFPTEVTQTPTLTSVPTEQNPTGSSAAQGDAVESVLKELEQMNQSADGMEDIPRSGFAGTPFVRPALRSDLLSVSSRQEAAARRGKGEKDLEPLEKFR
jgi:hypothetical protein